MAWASEKEAGGATEDKEEKIGDGVEESAGNVERKKVKEMIEEEFEKNM